MKILLVLLVMAGSVFSAEYKCSLVLDSAIKYVALANTGDTVTLGTNDNKIDSAEWKIHTQYAACLTVTKSIYLRSVKGHDSTVIIGDTSALSNECLIRIINNSNNLCRVSGFHFVHYKFTQGSTGAIVAGNKYWRVDHCVFDTSKDSGCRGLVAIGMGLVDSCYFVQTLQGVAAYGITATSDFTPGDSMWANPATKELGGLNSIYIEDCVFKDSSTLDGSVDGYTGKFVMRHCYVNNTNIGWHGYDTGPRRSTNCFEIYNNIIDWDLISNLNAALNVRGGTGVIYNNDFQGGVKITTEILLRNYRSYTDYSNVDPTLDRGKCNGNFHLDGNTVPCGYPCYDQVGTVGTTSIPLYIWGNTRAGTDTARISIDATSNECDSIHIKQDRDYFLTQKPGYTALPYPHPWIPTKERPKKHCNANYTRN